MRPRRDIHPAVRYVLGAISYFEELALDLLAQHGREPDQVIAHRISEEYEAVWELKETLEELLRRAQR